MGPISISIPNEYWGYTMTIILLVFLVIEYLLFFKMKHVFIVAIPIFIIFLILIKIVYSTRPKVIRPFLKDLDKVIGTAVDEYNKNTSNQHRDKNGDLVPTTIKWPFDGPDQETFIWQFVSVANLSSFGPIIKTIKNNSEIYKFISSVAEQYNFPLSELEPLFPDRILTSDNKSKSIAIALIKICLDNRQK
jgi:hypothetical protein